MLVSTVGTGGTITGVGSYLRSKNPKLRIYAVEPAEAPVLDTALYDEVISIPGDVAIETARELMRTEGLIAGVSTGANLAASRIVAARPEHGGQTIVTFLCDTGERYVSSELFQNVREG